MDTTNPITVVGLRLGNRHETRGQMGLKARRKGVKFELVVRDHLLEGLAMPSDSQLTIRRSSQAERAWDADLIIECPGAPDWLTNLWVECEHANTPNPHAKMSQALRDAGAATMRTSRQRTPIVVWRKTGERTLCMSTHAGLFYELTTGTYPTGVATQILITCRLDDLLLGLRGRLGRF